MTSVNFYKIHDGNLERLMLVCRVTAKAWDEGHPVFINTESPEQTSELDELLWNWNPTTFLPHSAVLQSDRGVINENIAEEQIVISHLDNPGEHHGVLINLKQTIPGWVSRFERAIEIVYDDQAVTVAKRNNFEFYKKRGYPLNFYDLTKNAN